MSVLERLATHDTEILHLQDSVKNMADFHMQILYIGLGVLIAGLYMVWKNNK